MAAAAAPRRDLGLALASEPLGPLVAGLPAHPGWSHSSAAYPAPLVQPPALAATSSTLRTVTGLAGRATGQLQEFTGKPSTFRPLAGASCALILVRTGSDALGPNGRQLQQPCQHTHALSRPGRCTWPRVVCRWMVATLKYSSSKTHRSDNSQFRQYCSTSFVVSLLSLIHISEPTRP